MRTRQLNEKRVGVILKILRHLVEKSGVHHHCAICDKFHGSFGGIIDNALLEEAKEARRRSRERFEVSEIMGQVIKADR